MVGPGVLALSDLLYQVDAGTGEQTWAVLQIFGLEKCQFKDVLTQVHVFGLQSCHFSQRLVEFEGGVDDEVEAEDADHIGLGFEELGCGVLVGAGRDELLDGGDLVGLLELGGDEEGGCPHQLQLSKGDCLGGEVAVDEGDHCEQGLGEHLVFVVEFGQPVYELGP